MIPYPNIDPVIFKIGPLSVRWYGVMYVLGFAVSYFLVKYQVTKNKKVVDIKFIDSMFLYIIVGLMLGGRLGYTAIYNFEYYFKNPMEIFAVWHGGMSFHGGLTGVIVAGVIFTKKYQLDFWRLADIVIVTVPIGLGLGRLGNFINGELYGRITNVPWGMVFPEGGPLPRHPSQLYEFLLEGIVLFTILWFLKDKNFKPSVLTSLFLILYGVFRIFIELFREPDSQIGYIFGFVTIGQILSVVMLLFGVSIIFYRKMTKRV